MRKFQGHSRKSNKGACQSNLHNLLKQCRARQQRPDLHDCTISVGSVGQATRYVCTILERSATQGHNAVQVFERPKGGLMSDLAGSIDLIGLGENFCVVLGDIQLSHFQYCIVQAPLEDNLKLWTILGSRVGSLRGVTSQCSSFGVRLKESCRFERFLGKMAECESK